MHAYTYTYIQKYIYEYIQKYTYTYTQKYTYTYTQKYIYEYLYTQIKMYKGLLERDTNLKTYFLKHVFLFCKYNGKEGISSSHIIFQEVKNI